MSPHLLRNPLAIFSSALALCMLTPCFFISCQNSLSFILFFLRLPVNLFPIPARHCSNFFRADKKSSSAVLIFCHVTRAFLISSQLISSLLFSARLSFSILRLSARLPSKSESGRCETEAFVRDFPQKVKVEDVKPKLSCETSLKK